MLILGIPVDPRLRDIVRELKQRNQSSSHSSPSSNHVEKLRQLSQSTHRGRMVSEDEGDFACYLAEPAVRGGIVVALMQPAPNQVYSIPTDQIVQNCETLRALRMLAKFFSLPFEQLSIFDAYPFITEQELDPENIDHLEAHDTFHEMILEKQPAVVLSGWRSPSFKSYKTKSLQKWGVGAMFPSPTIPYHGLTLERVSMPHPSYYMNYHPTESCFRQLQVLEFAQACGRLWGIWKEEKWMANLRTRCKVRAKDLYDNRRDFDSDAYRAERLIQTLNKLRPVIAGIHYGFSSDVTIEDYIYKHHLLELCSDASLILRHVDAMEGVERHECAEESKDFICEMFHCRWPEVRKSSLSVSAGRRGLYDHKCFNRIAVPDLPPLEQQIEFCLVDFAKKMNLSWASYGVEPQFDAQASAFLNLATAIRDVIYKIQDNNRVQYIANSTDIASESLLRRLAELGI